MASSTTACEAVETLATAGQAWRILRMAERIAREGGSDERAATLLAGRLVRAFRVALAAELRDRPNHTLARRN